MNVFSYLRVSGTSQVDKDGFPRQQEAIAKFCARHNLICLGEFKERGVSGTIDAMDRPDFSDMLQKAEAMVDFKIEAIVVENMDRLARDLMVSELLLRECRERNIKIFCTDQGELIDMAQEADPTRTMLRQILGAVSQWEKTRLVQKLRSAKQRNRLKEGWTEGKKPYGHTQRERDLLSEMRAMQAIGHSYADIASAMNAAGHRSRHSKLWTKHTVLSVMTGRRQKVK